MLVLLIKGKLFQTEGLLPLFTALKRISKKKVIIVYPSKLDFTHIKKNNDIFQALNKVAEVKYFYATFDLDKKFIHNKRSGAWYTFLGIISIIHRNFTLRFLLYKKSTIFSTEKIPFIDWILNFNKNMLKGKRIGLLIYPYNLSSFQNFIQRVINL